MRAAHDIKRSQTPSASWICYRYQPYVWLLLSRIPQYATSLYLHLFESRMAVTTTRTTAPCQSTHEPRRVDQALPLHRMSNRSLSGLQSCWLPFHVFQCLNHRFLYRQNEFWPMSHRVEPGWKVNRYVNLFFEAPCCSGGDWPKSSGACPEHGDGARNQRIPDET